MAELPFETELPLEYLAAEGLLRGDEQDIFMDEMDSDLVVLNGSIS